jgi:hypothetical protein
VDEGPPWLGARKRQTSEIIEVKTKGNNKQLNKLSTARILSLKIVFQSIKQVFKHNYSHRLQ